MIHYPENSKIKLDRTDMRILNMLQDNNLVTNQELSDHVGLSPPPCLRRVRKLRDIGVITGDVSIVDPFKVNRLQVFTSITLEQQREDLLHSFERKMREYKEVLQCYFISGDVDYMLVVNVEDINQYFEFSRRALASEPNIKSYRSNFCLNRIKFCTKIDLNEE